MCDNLVVMYMIFFAKDAHLRPSGGWKDRILQLGPGAGELLVAGEGSSAFMSAPKVLDRQVRLVGEFSDDRHVPEI